MYTKQMKIPLIVFILLLTACGNRVLEKPFTITNKYLTDNPAIVKYWYQDKNGLIESFFDSTSRYNVGDTLK
jgi:hypothetical protein